MNCRVLQLEEDCSAAIIAAARVLLTGGLIVFPTDTVYGLLAGAVQHDAYRRVYELKGRASDKPLALLVAAPGQAAQAVAALLEHWPAEREQFRAGLLTLVVSPDLLPASALPEPVHRIQPGPIGIRCPRHEPLQSLLREAGGAAWATSVNAAGQPPAVTPQQVVAWLQGLAGPPELAVLSSAPSRGRPSRAVHLTELG